MDGTGRSWSLGGVQPVLNVNIRSAMKRLNSRGERGSPWQRPKLDVKGRPSLAPSLIWADVLV